MAFRARFLPLTATLLLLGCAGSDLEGTLQERTDVAESRIEAARQPAALRSSDPLTVSDSVWLGGKTVRMTQGSPLPDQWEKPGAIALRSDTPVGLNQIMAVISSQTKIPVRLTDGAGQVDANAAAEAASKAPTTNTPGNPNTNANAALAPGMIVSYEGPLSGLLNMIAGYFNVTWSYEGGSLVVSRYQTRTFVMDALPGSIAIAAPGSTGASGDASSNATAEPLATATIDIWEDVRKTLNSIVGTDGTVDISQSSGTVIISTTNDRMDRVSRYIEEENRRLSRQVAISIELYSVNISDDANYGMDLTAALSSISGLPSINLTGPTPDSTAFSGAASMTVNLVEPNELDGTKSIVKALSVLGRTTRLAQIPVTTLNNRPANQRISVDKAYISSITTTVTGTAATSQTSAETDTVTTGISVSVLPRIMSDGRILLQYALAQGDLLSLKSFDVGEDSVQLPETQGISFSQQVMMKNASTLVLAGFDRGDDSNTTRGLSRPVTWALGGSNSSTHSRQLIVIAITPREIQIAQRGAS